MKLPNSLTSPNFLTKRRINTDKQFLIDFKKQVIYDYYNFNAVTDTWLLKLVHIFETEHSRYVSKNFPATFDTNRSPSSSLDCEGKRFWHSDRPGRIAQKALMVFSRVTPKAGIPFHRHTRVYIWRGHSMLIIRSYYCWCVDHSRCLFMVLCSKFTDIKNIGSNWFITSGYAI